MYIHGDFINQKGQKVSLYILTNNDYTQEMVIGDEVSDVFFAENPIEITNEVNNTFDHLLKQSASVNLLCGSYVPDFFSKSCRNAVVNVYMDDACVFAGFIEPQTFSQPYNERWDEVSLNCVDVLSALQYSNYRNIGAAGISYDTIKANGQDRSFAEIITECLNGITQNIDIVGNASVKYWYDGSKAIDASNANKYQIFNQVGISELLFLGEDESDVWQQDDVVEEIMRYLNLHIIQEGFEFYIFAWETLRQSSDKTTWHDIIDNTSKEAPRKAKTISLDNVADADANITIGDVYNQIELTADTTATNTLLESPLDSDYLQSPYVTKQLYMTEYSADGEGKTAQGAFEAMNKGETTNYGSGTITNWFIRIKKNSKWTLPMNGDVSVDIVDRFCSEGKYEHRLPKWMGENMAACLMGIGKVQVNTAHNDNSPTSVVDMTDSLVISVNGNDKDAEDEVYPNEAAIKAACPMAIYNGNAAGGNFSPADTSTKNYIVFTGKIVLNPIMDVSIGYTKWRTSGWYDWLTPDMTVPSRNNEDGRFYNREYYKADTPKDEVVWDADKDNGWYPYTGEGPQEYQFNYSAIGQSDDTVSKVGVIACMLVIGDKCVVETGTNGQPSDFVWQDYKERSECADDDEYYAQSFTLGVDPKIGDYLVGTQFDIQNNLDYKLNVEASGTAIPIEHKDKISGKVRFTILGPTNIMWDEITRRHPTFFRHTKWTTTSRLLLPHVSSIILEGFEAKVYSDNGMVDTEDTDNDIVYLSDTEEEFVNKKDDLEMKITSALTAEECAAMGVPNEVKMSMPSNLSTEEGILTIYDRNIDEKAKPEQIYVDAYYREYHKPRIILEQNLNGEQSIFDHYKHEALNKEFFVQGRGRNLIEGTTCLTLKEINND